MMVVYMYKLKAATFKVPLTTKHIKLLMLFNTTRKTSGLHTGARYRMDAARRCNALNTAPIVYSPSYRYCGVGRPGREEEVVRCAPRHSRPPPYIKCAAAAIAAASLTP